MRLQQDELAARISQAVSNDGVFEVQPGLHLSRFSQPTGPVYASLPPSFCVIAQGAKDVLLGANSFRYDPAHYLITTVELPLAGTVVEASRQFPYLSLRLVLDSTVVTSMMVESGDISQSGGDGGVTAVGVSPLDADLLDASLRLARLAAVPNDYRVVAPLVTREIVYRLLIGPQCNRLRHLAKFGGQAHRIARAIQTIRESFNQPLRIEDLARILHMSGSGFHAHFKAVTAMSPLQFQKQLRLQEARRLMISEQLDAGQAGFRVGYDDASQFNREYKRQFGEPPMRDIGRLREQVVLQ
ncbi:MAG TPA: AraC family transcriptional regulator [Pirellulales bacterium]|nr:AraC family transcriptional regulator [Pirellulales bacterium]